MIFSCIVNLSINIFLLILYKSMSYDAGLDSLRSGGNHFENLSNYADKVRSAIQNPQAGLADLQTGAMERMFGTQEKALGIVTLAKRNFVSTD